MVEGAGTGKQKPNPEEQCKYIKSMQKYQINPNPEEQCKPIKSMQICISINQSINLYALTQNRLCLVKSKTSSCYDTQFIDC